MNGETKPYAGGCLCGALRYEARGEPSASGHCYCADCRKASGSGFVPFMVFAGSVLTVRGAMRQFRSPAVSGRTAVRNYCPACGGLVFGGELGTDDTFTVYAGSLDEPARFRPRIAIFVRGRPAWAVIPPGLTAFEGLPD
ncbi:MAG TPA: GFA family protein [Steroidobacteraceae bacterium]|jgi:hypothetical protein|nr:GFA family protein [Steroidobacteraceae bacterium]